MQETGNKTFSQTSLPVGVIDMLQKSVALIGVYDPNEVLRYTNEAFRNAYFVEAGEHLDWQTLMRRNFAVRRGTVIETTDIEGWISSVRSRRGKSYQRTYESDLHDGRFIWVTETRRDDGWIVYVGTDVTALNKSERHLRLANEKLLQQSFTDELTGVSNRRHVLMKLKEILDAEEESWACLIDIDHFKNINDNYGHQIGDEVLISLSRAVRQTIHLKDSFGRVGGEEFLLLFPSNNFGEVKQKLIGIQKAIAQIGIVTKDSDVRVTISGGLTYFSARDTQDSILIRADCQLYGAKKNGRNRIHFANRSFDAVKQTAELGLAQI